MPCTTQQTFNRHHAYFTEQNKNRLCALVHEIGALKNYRVHRKQKNVGKMRSTFCRNLSAHFRKYKWTFKKLRAHNIIKVHIIIMGAHNSERECTILATLAPKILPLNALNGCFVCSHCCLTLFQFYFQFRAILLLKFIVKRNKA